MTVVTDLILGLVSLVLGLLLLRRGPGHTIPWLWVLGFLTASAAAWTGAAFHHIPAGSAPAQRQLLWTITVLLIGITVGWLLAAGVSMPLPRRARHTHWIYAGLALTLGAVAVQRSHLALGAEVNHNVFYHLLQAGAEFFFYRGVRLMP